VSPRTWKDRIRDILKAISEIQAFKHGMEMNLIIIGEAARQVPDDIQETYSRIPWSLMRAMRNRMAHVYFSVDERLLWETATEQLSELVPLLEAIL
jgi:uncharacterized protein with HEPN domain